MSSRVLDMCEVEAVDGALIGDTDAAPEAAPFECEAPAVTIQGDCLNISRAEGLRGVKGALTAVGLECAAAFCLYGVWQLWHHFR
jgi:hypothetical protein